MSGDQVAEVRQDGPVAVVDASMLQVAGRMVELLEPVVLDAFASGLVVEDPVLGLLSAIADYADDAENTLAWSGREPEDRLDAVVWARLGGRLHELLVVAAAVQDQAAGR